MRGYDCLCTCMTFAENYYGNKVEDFMLYFLVGPRIHYYDEELQGIASDSHGLLEDKISELFVPERDIKEISRKSLEEYVIHCSHENQIIIASVQSDLLTYRNIYMNNNASIHYICICDYSEETKQVKIADLFTPNYTDEGFQDWVDFDEICQAWEKYGFRHFIWEKSYVDLNMLEETVKEAVKETIICYLDGQRETQQVSGINIVSQWIDKIPDEVSVDHLFFQLKVTGLITIKRYLMEYFEYYNIANREVYKDIIVEWDKLSVILFYMKLKKKSSDLSFFKEKVHELLEKERIVLSEILEKI